eukprot:6185013-Pleurochrysis_carterae.AAC.1
MPLALIGGLGVINLATAVSSKFAVAPARQGDHADSKQRRAPRLDDDAKAYIYILPVVLDYLFTVVMLRT